MKWSFVMVLVAVTSCGRGAIDTRTAKLELVVPGTTIAMDGGQTRDIQILVIGAEQATLSANLPHFASLAGSLLTLSPGRGDAGDYELTLTATAGDESANAYLRVTVSAPNTAPSWDPSMTMLGDDTGIYTKFCGPTPCMSCPDASCVVGRPVSVYAMLCDAEGDSVTMEVEVVPLGTQLTKTPTRSRTAPMGGPQPLHCSDASPTCTCMEVPLPGLEAGTAYEFAIRVTDALGAVSRFPDASEGWVHYSYGQFKTTP